MIKVKLSPGDSFGIYQVLDKYITVHKLDPVYPKNYVDQVSMAALTNIRECTYNIAHSGKSSMKISECEALIFFGIFNGLVVEPTALKIAFSSICKQIEQQLFISGEYVLPAKKGVTNG